jgi:RecA/RadA recombinase
MSDEFTIGAEDLSLEAPPTKNVGKAAPVVEVRPEEISNAVEKTLPEEVKKDIKEKKTKRKAAPKKAKTEEVDTEDWKSSSLSAAEINQSKALQEDLFSFLKSHAKIEQGSGSIDKLPTGIDLLDAILGGGFGAGTFSIIAGLPGTFKSALLGQVIGTSQKKYKGKLLAAYKDSEQTMTKRRLFEMGVKYPPITPIDNVSVESVFRTVEALACFKEQNEIVDTPSIVGWDSIANTSTEKQINSENLDPAKVMGLKARILSSCLPVYVTKMKEYNISLIAINQLRDKIDMGMFPTANSLRYLGQSKTMPGGNAVQYNAFHILLISIATDLKEEQWGFRGVKLKAKCVKNKFFQPNIPIELIVDFNTGVSNFWTNYNFLTSTKRIKPGGWGYLIDHPTVKWQGTQNCLVKYHEDAEFRGAFDKAVKEAIQVEIVDKYTNFDFEEEMENS